MVKNHSDSERGNILPPHGLLFPTDRIAHTTAFVTPVVEHWLEREIAYFNRDIKVSNNWITGHNTKISQWFGIPSSMILAKKH